MRKLMMICLAVLAVNPVAMAGVIYFDDGGNHTISDSTYQNDEIWADYNVDNNPGTDVELKNGGAVFSLEGFHNATVTISGGTIEDDIQANSNATVTMTGGTVGSGASASQNATLNISGGSVYYIVGHSDATITMSGGAVGSDLVTFNRATITMSGGLVAALFRTYMDSTIYLEGTGFEVDGSPLVNGDKLSDFGTLFENGNTDYYTGTITGTLADGSALDNIFEIYNTGTYAGTADIIIIPEPATLLLLGLGVVMLRRKRVICKTFTCIKAGN